MFTGIRFTAPWFAGLIFAAPAGRVAEWLKAPDSKLKNDLCSLLFKVIYHHKNQETLMILHLSFAPIESI